MTVSAAYWGAHLPDPEETVRLWPETAPGTNDKAITLEIIERSTVPDFKDRVATGIQEPMMTVFRPEKPNGAGMLIVPGGNYVRVTIDNEGFETARRLSAAGITCFVLRYRLPFEGWGVDVPLGDAQRAMRVIRTRAGYYGVDPARIGVMGFSAGGHVAAQLATRYSESVFSTVDDVAAASARPAFQALIYPVVTMQRPYAFEGAVEALLGTDVSDEARGRYSCENLVDAKSPPAFLCVAQDDDVIAATGVRHYYESLLKADVAAELHMFERGGHGFGLRLAQGHSVALWPELFLGWAKSRGILG